MRHKPEVFGQAHATLISDQEVEIPEGSGCPRNQNVAWTNSATFWPVPETTSWKAVLWGTGILKDNSVVNDTSRKKNLGLSKQKGLENTAELQERDLKS